MKTVKRKTEKSKLLSDAENLEKVIEIKNNQTFSNSDLEENESLIEKLNESKTVENKTEESPLTGTKEPEVIDNIKQVSDLNNEKTGGNGLSFLNEMAEPTQEDLNKKNIEQRLDGLTSDDFQVNENSENPEAEDSPEFRKEMNKIRASALTEFFDVVFMIICLFISKDFTDKSQVKFSLATARKNAIKSNVYAILNQSKKKTNPMSAVFFLIVFSYIPLIAIAFMQRFKDKKEQKKIEESAKQNGAKLIELERENERLKNQIFSINNQNLNEEKNGALIVLKDRKEKDRKLNNKSVTYNEKTGIYKNLETGEKFKFGERRGRAPKWVSSFGKVA